ncbi:hypothetical protein MMC25_007685 [Agyrium rufum]|nr:hypothetical protein [Agyrium rufum]
MKEAIVKVRPDISTQIHEVPIPEPGDDEVCIKVVCAASNTKDWAHLRINNLSMNSGDDMSGTVHSMGASVAATAEFRVGDRVAAMHQMLTPGGAYAEYAIAPAHTVFKIPNNTSFEEAASIPLVALTAALSLYTRQRLPPPWAPRSSAAPPNPLIIYGASSALGCYAIKLAKLSNIGPIIAICGESRSYVESLLEIWKGDCIIDYRHGVEATKQAVREALGNSQAYHALDAISAHGTWVPLTQILDPRGGAQVSVVSGAYKYDEEEIPSGVEIIYTYVGTVHEGRYRPCMPRKPSNHEEVASDKDFAYIMLRYISRLLAQRQFEGHPYEVVPGGLAGVEVGLKKLKDGQAKGKKFVYRIANTPGLDATIDPDEM